MATSSIDIYDGSLSVMLAAGGNCIGSVLSDSIIATAGGDTEAKGIGTASVQSSAITTGSALVTSTVDCFFRQGTTPAAVAPVADGANGDAPLFGGNTYRISGISIGNKLAFITSGDTGVVYITPGA